MLDSPADGPAPLRPHSLRAGLHRLQHALWQRGLAPEPGVAGAGCPHCAREIGEDPALKALFHPDSES